MGNYKTWDSLKQLVNIWASGVGKYLVYTWYFDC